MPDHIIDQDQFGDYICIKCNIDAEVMYLPEYSNCPWSDSKIPTVKLKQKLPRSIRILKRLIFKDG